MRADAPESTVTIENVRAVSDGPSLVCEVAGRRVGIPLGFIRAGSEVHRRGDLGKLRIPRWLATNLQLVALPDRRSGVPNSD